MSVRRPSARITLDGRELSSAEAGVRRVEVILESGGSHDSAQVLLWPGSAFADAATGSSLVVALGDSGEEETVWTGTVESVRRSPDAIRVAGLAPTAVLSTSYKAQAYLQQSMGEVVRDLAGDVDIDTVDAPIRFEAYHVDNQRSAWNHLQALAALAVADLGSSAEGKLRFVGPDRLALPRLLRFGADLLGWEIESLPRPPASEYASPRAASEQGPSRWHWLTADPVGEGGPPKRLPGALATRDSAQLANRAAETRAARAERSGSLSLQGTPDLRPGDQIKLLQLPGEDPGTLRARRVQHRLDGRAGFSTEVAIEAAGMPGFGL